MDKKILFGLMFALLFISLVSSIGLDSVKQNDCIDLYQFCPSCSYVNLTAIKYPNATVFTMDLEMEKNGNNYNYTFCSTTKLGNHFYTVCGDKDGTETCEEIPFIVTPTGFLLESSESILYVVILIATFILFLAFLYPAIKLPYSNKINKDGSITRITKSKYLKLLSIWFAYGFLMWFLQTLNAISKSFISLTYLSNFITNIFSYTQWFSVGITFLILIILFIEVWKDIILSQTIKRYGKAFTDGRLQ